MENGNGNLVGIAALVGIYMTFALDVFSTLNSSPQTTEINAAKRADSLMFWVAIASAVAISGGVAGSIISRKIWPAVGAGVVTAGMYGLYVHAKRRGLARLDQPGTEDYGTSYQRV